MNNPLRIQLRLAVFRPDTLDPILTKMAREPLTTEQLRAAFARARVPEVPEIQSLFQAAQPKVLVLVLPVEF